MAFNKEKYLNEMEQLLENTVALLKKENKDFIIYSANIWTDPNAAISAVNFDSKAKSDVSIENSNAFNKKYYDIYMQSGDIEQAKLFEPITSRNTNPADFELSQYAIIENKSFEKNWEEETNGDCWDILEEALQEFALISRHKFNSLKLHPEFELSVNGREDWYMFTWS